VVPHAAAARDLQELYPTAEIRCWNLGLPEFRPLAVKDRRVIRDQLTGSQAALARERASPLVVYYGHGLAGPDSRWLWKLLSRMAERRADWTAWILGTGPAWHGLWRSAMEAGLEDRIVFPGDFGDLADVIAAADLVLFPQTQKWLTYPWLLTVAAQTPHLISRTEGVLEVIRRASGEVGELEPEWSNVLPSGDLEAWVAAAESLLECAEGVHRQLRWQRSVLAGVGSQLASLADFEQGLLQWFGRHERR
jgi:glycosyltransferase involved in cell wall biosynthesis